MNPKLDFIRKPHSPASARMPSRCDLRKSVYRTALAICLSVTFWLGSLAASQGQVVIRRGNIAINAVPALAIEQETQDASSGSATLKTDPDLESLLEKAQRYLDDGNYSLASQLWQVVLEKSGDTLFSLDGKTYFSMVDQVEKILSQLPPEALQVYRINADAEAKQILARAGESNNRQALSEVVRRYFVSSVGDDAAFELATVAIDQYDFLGALRLLEKIRDRHPDPSIPPEELLRRLVLCHTLVGNRQTAATTLAELEQMATATNSSRMLGDLLQKSPEELSQAFSLMSLSSFRRFRVSPALPENALDQDLFAEWQLWIEPTVTGLYQQPDLEGRTQISTPENVSDLAKTVNETETRLIDNWKEYNWRPTGQILFHDEQMLFKSSANLSSWPTDVADRPVWRSVWMNQYIPDDATTQMEAIRNSWGRRGMNELGGGARIQPSEGESVSLFGDDIHAQMSIVGDRLYSLEGKIYDDPVPKNTRQNRGFQWNASFRRSRQNFLTCYEADSGRLLWTLPENTSTAFRSPDVPVDEAAGDAKVGSEQWLTTGGFMAAPIGYANSLLVPVNLGGAIYIYALDPQDRGKTLWKTYLCDEPETGAASWSPIQLTLEGSDLFVGCGMGVVFVLDPATGLIRFAQRYDRVGTPNQALRQFGWQVNRMEFDGWREDVIIPYGRQMICFASDSDKIFAIDRSSGELIWFVEMNPLGKKIDYLIGIHNDRLYAGGSETVVAFDLLGEGRMAWGGDALFDGGVSMGKAMLCGDALYVPVNDSIWKFTLPQNTEELPQKVAQAHVDLGTSAPVGNLFSDGKRIWVHQGNRVSALAPIAASSTPSETPAEIDTLANATDSQDAVLESTDSRATPLLKPRTDPQPFSPTLPNNQ